MSRFHSTLATTSRRRSLLLVAFLAAANTRLWLLPVVQARHWRDVVDPRLYRFPGLDADRILLVQEHDPLLIQRTTPPPTPPPTPNPTSVTPSTSTAPSILVLEPAKPSLAPGTLAPPPLSPSSSPTTTPVPTTVPTPLPPPVGTSPAPQPPTHYQCQPNEIMFELNLLDAWGDGWDTTRLRIIRISSSSVDDNSSQTNHTAGDDEDDDDLTISYNSSVFEEGTEEYMTNITTLSKVVTMGLVEDDSNGTKDLENTSMAEPYLLVDSIYTTTTTTQETSWTNQSAVDGNDTKYMTTIAPEPVEFEPIYNGTLENGFQKSDYVCLEPQSCYSVVIDGGKWETDIAWQLRLPVVLSNMNDDDNVVIAHNETTTKNETNTTNNNNKNSNNSTKSNWEYYYLVPHGQAPLECQFSFGAAALDNATTSWMMPGDGNGNNTSGTPILVLGSGACPNTCNNARSTAPSHHPTSVSPTTTALPTTAVEDSTGYSTTATPFPTTTSPSPWSSLVPSTTTSSIVPTTDYPLSPPPSMTPPPSAASWVPQLTLAPTSQPPEPVPSPRPSSSGSSLFSSFPPIPSPPTVVPQVSATHNNSTTTTTTTPPHPRGPTLSSSSSNSTGGGGRWFDVTATKSPSAANATWGDNNPAVWTSPAGDYYYYYSPAASPAAAPVVTEVRPPPS
ncbi:hypothetical protein ACA910_003970 [Epithemia clementina (nom. ined.)]